MTQLAILDLKPTSQTPRTSRLTADEVSRIEPEFYHRIGWGYTDTILEPCGYTRRVLIEHLEDPNFKLKPICPWGDTEHWHNERDKPNGQA